MNKPTYSEVIRVFLEEYDHFMPYDRYCYLNDRRPSLTKPIELDEDYVKVLFSENSIFFVIFSI